MCKDCKYNKKALSKMRTMWLEVLAMEIEYLDSIWS